MTRRHFQATAAVALLGIAALSTIVHSESVTESPRCVGHARAPVLILDSPVVLVGMPWERYQETIIPLSSIKSFVALRAPLAGEASEVQYGLNAVLPVGSSRTVRNLSWALIASGDQPPALIVDLNANGDLSDEARIEFIGKDVGPYEAEHRIMLSDSGDKELGFPVHWHAVKNSDGIQLSRYVWRERRGTIEVGGESYEFALRTPLPVFDSSDSLVGIDLNRDGKLQFLRGDIEVFRVQDEYISVAGLEYRLTVERGGDRLTLAPTGSPAISRPFLVVGANAPTLPNGDPLMGEVGEPVFLNFWSPRCSFSKRMAPQLLRARQELQGFRFVSITNVDKEEALSTSAAFGHEWAQLAGEVGQRLFSLYRVAEVPTYYVIDPEGVIVARGSTLEWTQIRAEMDRVSHSTSDSSPQFNRSETMPESQREKR